MKNITFTFTTLITCVLLLGAGNPASATSVTFTPDTSVYNFGNAVVGSGPQVFNFAIDAVLDSGETYTDYGTNNSGNMGISLLQYSGAGTALDPLHWAYEITFDPIAAIGYNALIQVVLNGQLSCFDVSGQPACFPSYSTNYLSVYGYGVEPVSAVPLPAALPLYGTGLAAMGFMGWRRRKSTERN